MTDRERARGRREEESAAKPAKLGAETKNARGPDLGFRALTIRLKFRSFFKSSSGRTRTCDPAVNSRLLYQLSYRGSLASQNLIRQKRTVTLMIGIKKWSRAEGLLLMGLGSDRTPTVNGIMV